MSSNHTVLAALDDSEAAAGVAQVARRLGALLGCTVAAIHVREDGGRTAAAAGRFVGLDVRTLEGDVIATLVAHAGPDTIIVLGSSDRPRIGDPVGHVARALMTQLADPIVLVPPGATMDEPAATLLVPMDGSTVSRRTLDTVLAVVDGAPCDLTALHVLDDARLPPFGDQVHLEAEAWAREFQDRHCTGAVHLEIRVGAPPEQILRVADEQHAALIVVGWSRHYEPDRARTLRELMTHSVRPLLLLPADGAARA